MATPAMYDVMLFQFRTVGKNIIREILWVQKGEDNIGTYIPVNQLRKLIDSAMHILKSNPKLVEDIHKKTVKYNKDYFNYAKEILKINLKNLSNRQLSKIYNKLNWHQKISHGYAVTTTWFIDSDGEDFSRYLMKELKNVIKISKSKLKFAESFSVLTTPSKLSMGINEEIESLKILKEINKNKKAKKIFLQNDIKKIEDDLIKIDNKLKKKIISHYKKWRWIPFTYMGPAYEFDYYLEIWSGLLKQKLNINNELKKIINHQKKIEKRKIEITAKLNISPDLRRLFNIACEIIYLKAYRKDCLFYGMYVLDKLLREMATRLHLSLGQVRFMADWEVEPALKRGSFSEDILNERIKFSVYYQKGEKGIIYAGEKAKEFLSKLNLEKIKVKKTSRLEGASAFPGKIKGKVKIINLPEEMEKMNQNDVMVAHTTFPSLVPAMKKASAIVTDDGGITCHAAIVAREMEKPCVVGTKVATQVLKDGDIVEVDAEKGIVRIIKQYVK